MGFAVRSRPGRDGLRRHDLSNCHGFDRRFRFSSATPTEKLSIAGATAVRFGHDLAPAARNGGARTGMVCPVETEPVGGIRVRRGSGGTRLPRRGERSTDRDSARDPLRSVCLGGWRHTDTRAGSLRRAASNGRTRRAVRLPGSSPDGVANAGRRRVPARSAIVPVRSAGVGSAPGRGTAGAAFGPLPGYPRAVPRRDGTRPRREGQ